MDNSNINQEDLTFEENLISPELIKQENDEIENIECIDIDEIFPNMEEVDENISDPIFDNLRNLKTCNECGIHTDCIVKNQENGKEVYFCTEKCMILNSYKTTPRLIYSQPSTSASTSSALASSALASSASASSASASSSASTATSSSPMIISDAASLYVRICSTCSAIIQINDYSNISWQARDFCNEKCLTKHQVRFNSYCVECKCSIADANHFGKFSMKFGNNIRTFCSKLCLDKYKITLNMCQFCNNNIPNDAQHKYLAPVTECSTTFKQFCSINCVKNYCHYKLKLPYQNEAENYANCVICNTLKFVEVKFQYREKITFTFCSDICFGKFQYLNKIDAVKCIICKVLYEKAQFQKYCLYDNGMKNFCGENCQTTYYIIARYIVECNDCQVKKYNFDMIQKIFPNNQTIYACSFECLKNSYKNMSRPIVSSSSQNDFRRLYGNLKNMMTLTVAKNGALANKNNVSTICYPIQNNVSTSMDIETADKQTQTPITLIPAPVPVYVSTPLPVDQVQVPFALPVPVPIPVPIFLPTGCRTQEEYKLKMNKILKELPQDQNQANLMNLAKTLNPAEEKTSSPKSKLTKTMDKKLAKKEHSFGLFTLKRWIKKSNERKENDAFNLKLDSKSAFFKTNILYMTKDELHKCLIAFLENTKRIHSSVTIYIIFLDIQHYLLHHNKQIYIFLDISFKKFIEDFNEITFGFHNIYKLNSKLTEDYLWNTNQLGTHTPFTLLNSLIYYNFKLFGLKTIQEHLTLLSTQITISKNSVTNIPETKKKCMYHLKYSPNTTNEYGNRVQEIDKQFYNEDRCAALLYEFYVKKCPAITENDNNSFYLKPELGIEADSPIWFSNQTLDEWTIEMMLNRIKMVKEINEV